MGIRDLWTGRGHRRASRGTGPTLSVVVPAYGVEDYLEECLASILGQSYRDLEVIVVDDGSPDRSGEIADRVAATDPRVRVVHQRNVGLGATRNTGAALAGGTYLAFVDSDDVVCPGAYARLVASLETTGSDLAIGSVERVDGERVFTTPLVRENHRQPLRSATLEEAPLMLGDCFAWNKVFRRAFWEEAGLAFPARVSYEDQPTITRALVEARRFDSLVEPVYRWRVRGDGSSISQQRARLRDLSDRIRTKRWATIMLRDRVTAATLHTWYARVLPIDMWEYFRCVPGCSEEYWSLLREGLAEFWGAHTVPFEHTGVPPRQRLMGRMVSQGRRAELEELLAAPPAGGSPAPGTDARPGEREAVRPARPA